MTNSETKNISASIKARLLNLSRERQKPFQETLQYFAMERFLFRLSKTSYRDQLVLKGALLINAWDIEDSRATRDIDILARVSNDLEEIVQLVQQICDTDFSRQDGLVFHSHTVSGRVMQTKRTYEGIRVTFQSSLERARIPMQIDFGFGDLVTPKPVDMKYPVLLDLPVPILCGYPPETVVAEKLHAMAEKGLLNSRVKDYYDVWILVREFELKLLHKAVSRTFERRGLPLEIKKLAALIRNFGNSEDRQLLWEGFCKRYAFSNIQPRTLHETCHDIARFIETSFKEDA